MAAALLSDAAGSCEPQAEPLSFELEEFGKNLVVRVRGTRASSAAEVLLDAARNALLVTAPAGELKIPLPQEAAVAFQDPTSPWSWPGPSAKWRKKTKTLEISLPWSLRAESAAPATGDRSEASATPETAAKAPPAAGPLVEAAASGPRDVLPAVSEAREAGYPGAAHGSANAEELGKPVAPPPPFVIAREKALDEASAAAHDAAASGEPLGSSGEPVPPRRRPADAVIRLPRGGAGAVVNAAAAATAAPTAPAPKKTEKAKAAFTASAAATTKSSGGGAAAAGAAVGSLWNANSWHWEERNHSEAVREAVRTTLAELKIDLPAEALAGEKSVAVPDGASEKGRVPGPAQIRFSGVDVQGDASSCVRKGKRIMLYELKLTANWACAATEERGTLSVPELSTDSPAAQTLLEITRSKRAGQRKDAGPAELALRKKNSPAAKALRAALGAAEMTLQAADDRGCSAAASGGSEDKTAAPDPAEDKEALLRADAERRAEEKRKAEEARATSGEMQRRIAAEEKAKEERKILETKAWTYLAECQNGAAVAASAAQAAAGPQPLVGAPQGQEGGPAPSVWNPRGYHWEERPQLTWAKEWLAQRLGKVGVIPLMRGAAECRFTSVGKVSGHASTSLRRGKKIVLFELNIEVEFLAELLDGSGQPLGRCEGTLKVEEFTSEDPDDPLVVVEPKKKATGQGSQLAKELETTAWKKALTPVLLAFREALQQR